jgi:hypothetical protein
MKLPPLPTPKYISFDGLAFTEAQMLAYATLCRADLVAEVEAAKNVIGNMQDERIALRAEMDRLTMEVQHRCEAFVIVDTAYDSCQIERDELRAEVDRLKSRIADSGVELQALLNAPKVETTLWLWKNFVNGKQEYWAFDNMCPINMDDRTPQTLGAPCGYALFKPSRDGLGQ